MYHVRDTFTALVRPLRIEYRNVFGCKPHSAAASATRIIGTPNTSLFVFIVELVLMMDLDIDISRASLFPLFPLAVMTGNASSAI